MARTAATLPGGPRLSDHLSIGVLAHVFPRPAVRASLAACGRTSRRRRDLPAEVMVYFVLALGLFRSVSTREVLRCLAEGLHWLGAGPLRLAGRAALSHARKRLGVEPLRELRRRCVRARATAATPGATWRGLALRAWDGTTLDLPDEAVNREAFGKPGASRGEAAFPQVRLTALVEVGTRVPLAWTQGPYRESETAQAQRLHDHLGPGQLLLADRGYLGKDHWQQAAATGAQLLWRARRDTDLPVDRVLADGSWLSPYGDGLVRVVAYTLAEAPDETYRLVTTLLEPETAPAVELAALYHERWEIETAYDELKTHMLGPRPSLRSKTPELVRQEVEGLLLAYHAVRAFLAEAARDEDLDPDHLSFVHAVRVVRRRLQNPGPRRRARIARVRDLCREILEERAGSSRGLRHPRGVKRKMSNYPIRRSGPLDRRRHAWMPLILAPAC